MNLPADFLTWARGAFGDEYDAFISALTTNPSVSVRTNGLKCSTVGEELKATLPVDGPVAWCPGGFYLESRPTFTLDPLLHAGAYYVQEASSMIVSHIVRQFVSGPVRFLDLCAAPGGKSTLLLDVLPEGSLLVCNEYIRQRSYILAENVTKWGRPNAVVTSCDASSFSSLGPVFDAMLVDAPCSGEGMFRKDDVAVSEWSLDNVALCAERQRDILSSAWTVLKPGGLLLYSTCTYNEQEDERMVEYIKETLGAELLPVSLDPSWGITDTGLGLHFYPHKTRGEGLFIAVLRKHGEMTSEPEVSYARKVKRKGKAVVSQKIDVEAASWLSSPDGYEVMMHRERYFAVPAAHYDFVRRLLPFVNVLSCGVALGAFKGKTFIPDTALALSSALDHSKVSTYDATRQEALSFLHRESLVLPPSVPKGYVLITYKGLGLGWVKNIGNRSNNLYPEQWRIRMNIS
ncbi:MAG: rRNA cytosine-C5-methyltransferase [Paludibacteraceae bacterium]|nr:rRNA cytosine-C5-methyltransferase [Paludibacteraceae bacterium]